MRLLRSFGFAVEGIVHTYKTQANFRIHTWITVGIIIAIFALRVSLDQAAILVLLIGLVLQAELFNTALEAIVDHVSPEYHALAKIAKDCAAGAVFVTAGVAIVVGALVFGPKLWAVFAR